MKKNLIPTIVTGLMLPSAMQAAVILASDAGFVTSAGGSAKGDATVTPLAKYNYSVGFELHYGTGALGAPLAPMDRRNYFVFDLTGVTDTITSATITLWTGTYESVHGTESFGLFDSTDPAGAKGLATALAGGTMTTEFDSPADSLVMAAGTLYTKLADGPMFLGGAVISTAIDDSYLTITLTPAGLGYLNTFLGSTVIFGGKVVSVVPPPAPQQPFGFTGPDSFPGAKTPTLTITTVPEPSTVLLLMLGGLACTARQRRTLRSQA